MDSVVQLPPLANLREKNEEKRKGGGGIRTSVLRLGLIDT